MGECPELKLESQFALAITESWSFVKPTYVNSYVTIPLHCRFLCSADSDIRFRRSVSESAAPRNRLIGNNTRVPGAVLPFSQKKLSSVNRTELQDMIRKYKSSGPETPAFIPDDADPLNGDDPANPLRS
jgi:hypothetical protein